MQSITKASKNLGVVAAKGHVRCFASQPPLTVEFPGTPALKPAGDRPKPTTKVTTLSNGLRVASEETYQQATTISMFVDAGSQYETDNTQGTSSFLAHMAFKSTESRSHLRTVRDLEEIGGTVSAESTRDYIQYNTDVLRSDAETGVELLADTLLRPKYAPWDVDEQRKVITYENEAHAQDPGTIVNEKMHEAAFTDCTPLGRSRFCPARNVSKITSEGIKSFADGLYSADRMVLSGAGIEHERLVELAEKHLSGLKPTLDAQPVLPESKYVGGERRIREDSPLTHVGLGFETCNWKSDDLMEMCVLNLLLGGGGSFSAGGPGKGMYSRLYTNILNQHGWVESAASFHCLYNNAGFMGIYGACLPSYAGRFVDVMSAELISLAEKAPDAQETSRAKNQLKSAVLTSLDSRVQMAEDMGRQILTYGERKDAATLSAAIDEVTPERIQTLVQKALKTPVSLAAYGDVSAIPTLDTISNKFK